MKKFAVGILALLALSIYFLNYKMIHRDNASVSKVTIRGYYSEPKSMRDKDTIVLKGILEGEFIEVKVQGVIKGFKLVRLKWDENKNVFIEEEDVHEIDLIQDKTIVIKTYMPEGVPAEKIKWESITGKKYEFVIGEDLGDDADHLWEFILK